MKSFVIIVSAMLFWAEFLAAQNRDCYEETKLSKIAIRLASLGHVGSGNVWNFYHSLQHEKNISQTLLFRKDSINVQHIVSLERRTSKSYTVSDNSVYEDGFENGLQKYSYEIKPKYMSLPLSEDISAGIFLGYGTYSGKISSCIFGEYKVCCDAYGIVVTPENDTIRNVLRLHSSKKVFTSTCRTDNETFASNEMTVDSIKGIVAAAQFCYSVDEYKWFVEGFKFPIMEYSILETPDKKTRCEESFYCPLSMQQENAYGQSKLFPETLRLTDRSKERNLDYSFSQEVSAHTIKVNYTAKESCDVTVELAGTTGILYASASRTQSTEGTVTLPYGGLPLGQYVVKIICNGEVYAEKFNYK